MKSVVLVNDTTTQMHHGCELVMKQIRDLLALRNINVIATSAEGTNWREDRRFLHKVAKCDGIIVNGEGTIHHNRPAGRLLLEVTELAEQYKLPIYLINTTYQENPADFKHYLDKFDGIFVREGESAKELNNLGVACTVVPDLTLSYSYSPQKSRSSIGVSDSSIEPVSQKLFTLSRAHQAKFLPVIRSRKYDGTFNLTEFLRDIKFDLTRLKLKKSNTNNYLALRNLYLKKTIATFFDEVASCHVVISGRFHVICFCILTDTPFLAIDGNSHKIQSMLRDIGLSEKRMVSPEEIVNIPMHLDHSFSEHELNALATFKQQAKVRINSMFDVIAQRIHAR